MTIEQLPSGSFRVSKQINGKRYRFTFDHLPNEAEIALQLVKVSHEIITDNSDTFEICLEKYIAAKDNVLSPSTVVYYKQQGRALPEWFTQKRIDSITQIDVQKVVNDFAVNHAPKTVHNIHGVITAVMGLFRPELILHTSLPKSKPYEPKLPTHDDIKRILKASQGTEYHIAFQLGVLGLRRGEIIALELADLDGDLLKIDKSKALSVDGAFRVKNTPKTVASVRYIRLPDKLVKEINKKGYFFKGYPGTICKNLHRIQDKLNIPRCRFHDLRHYFVSYAHYIGWSDADIIAFVGHKTDYVTKRVYRHALANSDEKKQLANDILG